MWKQLTTEMINEFIFKCSDFNTTICNSLSILRQEKAFFDVTLVTTDNKHIPGHRLVLSACSDFFKSILINNLHSYPLIYLSGIHSTALAPIVDYMYEGQIQVSLDTVDNILNVARKLKIKGLIPVTENNVTKSSFGPFPCRGNNNDDQTDSNKKQSATKIRIEETVTNKSSTSSKYQEYFDYDGDIYQCKVCNYKSQRRTSMMQHIETHIEGLSYSCPVCYKTYRSAHSLSSHKSMYHRQKNK